MRAICDTPAKLEGMMAALVNRGVEIIAWHEHCPVVGIDVKTSLMVRIILQKSHINTVLLRLLHLQA